MISSIANKINQDCGKLLLVNPTQNYWIVIRGKKKKKTKTNKKRQTKKSVGFPTRGHALR